MGSINLGSNGTITNLAVGGLPDGTVDNDTLANNASDSAEIAAGAVDLAHLSATGTASSSTFLRGDNAWAAAGGGKVVKHAFQSYSTQGSTTSSTFVDTGLTIDYTPAAANNLIYVICMQQCYMWNNGSGDGRAQWQLLEGSNVLALTQFECSGTGSSLEYVGTQPLQGKFTAANTSAVTIKTQYRRVSAGGAAAPHTQHGSRASNITIIEVEP